MHITFMLLLHVSPQCQDVIAFLRYQPGFIDVENFKLVSQLLKLNKRICNQPQGAPIFAATQKSGCGMA